MTNQSPLQSVKHLPPSSAFIRAPHWRSSSSLSTPHFGICLSRKLSSGTLEPPWPHGL